MVLLPVWGLIVVVWYWLSSIFLRAYRYGMRKNNYYNRDFYGMNLVNPVEAMENGKNNKAQETRLIASGNVTITFFAGTFTKEFFYIRPQKLLEDDFYSTCTY